MKEKTVKWREQVRRRTKNKVIIVHKTKERKKKTPIESLMRRRVIGTRLDQEKNIRICPNFPLIVAVVSL
jgi:hypothetical protein